MSKERDLLKRWLSEFGRICCNKNLLIETKELLAKRQPLNLDISEFQRGFGAALAHAIYVKEPTRQLLSDEKLKTIAVEEEFLLYCNEDEFIEIARAIEKAIASAKGEDVL